MTNRFVFLLFFLAIVGQTHAQFKIDSLHTELSKTKNDTLRLIINIQLSDAFSEINPDSAYYYGERGNQLAQKMNFRLEQSHTLEEMAYAMMNKGNQPKALQLFLKGLALADDPNSEKNIIPATYPDANEFSDRKMTPHYQRLYQQARSNQYGGMLYSNTGNYSKAMFHLRESNKICDQIDNKRLSCIVKLTIGRVFTNTNKLDSALIMVQKSYELSSEMKYRRYLGSILFNLGRIHTLLNNRTLAIDFLKQARTESFDQGYLRGVVASNLLLANFYKQMGNIDSSFFFISEAQSVAESLHSPELMLRTYIALAGYYGNKKQNDSIVKYQGLIIKINDSIFSARQVQQFQNIDFEAQQRQKELEVAEKQFKDKLQRNILMGSLGTFLIVAVLLWRNIRHRKKSAAILQKQKDELEKTLLELKTTQGQLIQSEKMASLGELTAGIAHEIQNPLNFVNNFSEVNSELITEMNEALAKGNFEEAKSIAATINDNEQKIIFHGKRADAIVKGMLQHSRSSNGQKEPTDINQLVDEYLRLAYHGLRAKDKSFNATIKTDFDEAVDNVNVIPQDLGRVVLNLITNAFYAVSQKRAQLAERIAGSNESSPYEPTVFVSTKKLNGKIQIVVRDNGDGMPKNIADKIFQPFFTTKPTGKGTGLGLSMAYDIITKGHGGELKVETKEGEGAEFFVILNT